MKLHYYDIIVKTYRNGELIHSDCNGPVICYELKPERINITWENLKEFISSGRGLSCGFTYYTFKKGRVISFWNFSFFKKNTWDIREWKYSNPNITIEYEYRDIKNYSINDIMKYHNGKIAMEFLKQEGMAN